MKNIYITIIVVASSVSSLYSQLRFDIVGGVSAGATPVSAGVIINRHLPHEEFIFNLAKVDPQLHAGIKSQVELTAPFFLEGGLLYTRSSSTYDVTYTIIDTEHPIPNHLMKETGATSKEDGQQIEKLIHDRLPLGKQSQVTAKRWIQEKLELAKA